MWARVVLELAVVALGVAAGRWAWPREHAETSSSMESGCNPADASRTSFPIVIVADLDLKSRDPEKFLWRSILRPGTLRREPNGNYSVEWEADVTLTSKTARSNRSMELSEVIVFQNNLLGFCDYTGIVYEIQRTGLWQRVALADGNGKEVKPFKAEWAVVKDGKLYIGSMGKEWTNDIGLVEHTDPQWIKVMEPSGRIRNVNWERQYSLLRNASDAAFPGYLLHEAVVWDACRREWIFLPRRAGHDLPYDPVVDEKQGTNLMITASEDFERLTTKRVGPLELEWGFSAARMIPGTKDILALKIFEVNGETKTRITVFDTEGRFHMDPPFVTVSDDVKFEGLEIDAVF